jgi:hypothetical protein
MTSIGARERRSPILTEVNRRHVRSLHTVKGKEVHQCPRCRKGFKFHKDLESHVRGPICAISEVEGNPNDDCGDPEDGISVGIERALVNRKIHSKVETWEDIWKTLFPMDVVIPSSGNATVPFPNTTKKKHRLCTRSSYVDLTRLGFEPPAELHEFHSFLLADTKTLQSQLESKMKEKLEEKLEEQIRVTGVGRADVSKELTALVMEEVTGYINMQFFLCRNQRRTDFAALARSRSRSKSQPISNRRHPETNVGRNSKELEMRDCHVLEKSTPNQRPILPASRASSITSTKSSSNTPQYLAPNAAIFLNPSTASITPAGLYKQPWLDEKINHEARFEPERARLITPISQSPTDQVDSVLSLATRQYESVSPVASDGLVSFWGGGPKFSFPSSSSPVGLQREPLAATHPVYELAELEAQHPLDTSGNAAAAWDSPIDMETIPTFEFIELPGSDIELSQSEASMNAQPSVSNTDRSSLAMPPPSHSKSRMSTWP